MQKLCHALPQFKNFNRKLASVMTHERSRYGDIASILGLLNSGIQRLVACAKITAAPNSAQRRMQNRGVMPKRPPSLDPGVGVTGTQPLIRCPTLLMIGSWITAPYITAAEYLMSVTVWKSLNFSWGFRLRPPNRPNSTHVAGNNAYTLSLVYPLHKLISQHVGPQSLSSVGICAHFY